MAKKTNSNFGPVIWSDRSRPQTAGLRTGGPLMNGRSGMGAAPMSGRGGMRPAPRFGAPSAAPSRFGSMGKSMPSTSRMGTINPAGKRRGAPSAPAPAMRTHRKSGK